MKLKPFQTPAPRPEAVDVPSAELERRIAREKFAKRMAPLAELLAHPDEGPHTPASRGERAECSHLLHDADPDSTFPAFRVDLTKRQSEEGS